MKNKVILVLIVLGLLATCTFVGWMFGYDFDHRNGDTGWFTIFSLAVTCLFTGVAYDNLS